jgi:hypothetical protein
MRVRAGVRVRFRVRVRVRVRVRLVSHCPCNAIGRQANPSGIG